MTSLIIIVGIIIISGLSFWLPKRQGKKELGFTISIILATTLSLILIPEEGIFFIFLLFPILFFAVIFIAYWILINLGFKKAGRIVAISFSIIALLPILAFVFEDFLFFKSNARTMLKENDIVLIDNFSITSNNISGMRDLYQRFELEISDSDKNRLIKQLRESQFFKDTIVQEYDLQNEMDRKLSKRVFKDYEQNDFIRRESYEKLKQGYKPDLDIITISKTNNTLIFERAND